ncbi:MAG: NAD-dependent epimerase/dehydratase family protein [Candidatus Aenigmarchaeota archaeon]|nr:NAD-dependent epimerase/dehydratase family protein [Candidatus Aenigmarchaeota archaeon]
MSFYEGKRVLVTGGTGMIGSHLAEILVDQGADVRINEFRTPAENIFSNEYLKKMEVIKTDLTEREGCEKAVRGMEVVFNLATRITGVIGNIEHPVQMFTPNVLMQTNMIEAAHKENVDRYLYQSSACIYSSECEIPYEEKDGMKSIPDRTNEAYAWMKRMGEQQAIFYHREFGMKIGISRPFNTYGPRDNFGGETSHVIPAMIVKAESRTDPFSIWGDGSSTRDFVYVTDMAKGAMRVLEKHPKADPINIASGREISTLDLAKIILKESGFVDAKLEVDDTKPGGQRRRCGSVEKMRNVLEFEPEVGLESGIAKTVRWFRENKDKIKRYK